MKCLAAIVLLVPLAVTAYGDSLRAQIEKYDREVSRAMMKKDAAKMAKLMRDEVTPDFKYEEAGRSLSIDDITKRLGAGLNMMQPILSATTRIIRLQEQRKSATCTTEYEMTGIIVGADKKRHKMVSAGVADRSLVNVGSRWKISKMVWVKDKMTLDGKPMEPSKRMNPRGD